MEAQQNNPHSLLWWMKRLIALRKRHQAFGRGTLEFLTPRNHKVLVFLRRFQEEQILVVANLSRFVQYVELDLASFKGMVPVEMLGQTAMPPIGELPYLLTLGPYAFYWLHLQPKYAVQPFLATMDGQLPTFEVADAWKRSSATESEKTWSASCCSICAGSSGSRSREDRPSRADRRTTADPLRRVAGRHRPGSDRVRGG